MRRKYFTKASWFEAEDWHLNHSPAGNITVFEPSPEPRSSGLLDKDGNELMYIETIDQIGFIRWDD